MNILKILEICVFGINLENEFRLLFYYRSHRSQWTIQMLPYPLKGMQADC